MHREKIRFNIAVRYKTDPTPRGYDILTRLVTLLACKFVKYPPVTAGGGNQGVGPHYDGMFLTLVRP